LPGITSFFFKTVYTNTEAKIYCKSYSSSFAELSPNRPWEVVAPAGSELPFRTDITVETTCNLLDKAYIREVLVAAGLYDDDGSLDNKARPICDDIFDDEVGDGSLDHRMLFDLANEALQMLVHGAKTGSSLGQWVTDSTGVSMSRGRKLVDDVWQQVNQEVCSTLFITMPIFFLLLYSSFASCFRFKL
jgi:hypothetical protein